MVQTAADYATVPPSFKEVLGVSVISTMRPILADILVSSLKTEAPGKGISV